MDSEASQDSAFKDEEPMNIRLQPFQPNKYVLRVKTRPQRASVITEEASSSSSEERNKKNQSARSSIRLPELKAQCSTDSSDMSSSQNNITNSTSTSISRMENGEKIPRLVPGVYHKIPTPILSEHEKSILSNNNDVDSKSPKLNPGTSSGMRGPPPAWLPPCPPDKDHDYENNYEDPENLQKAKDMSRELLLNNSCPPPMYNSYELSLSQQRRSKASTANISTTASNEEWHSDDGNQRVLHKNSEGTYYIPSVAVSEHTTTSTLSPTSQIRYQDQCAGMLTTGRGTLTSSKGDPATATLIKYNTTASLSRPVANKKRSPIMHEYLDKRDKDSASIWKPSVCMAALLVALIISLIIIVLLLLRSPHYVYSELSPAASRVQADSMAVDESILRPLPAIIGVGERIEADIPPKHTVITEIFISRPIRILFNITLGAGAQMVLLGRHSVPPTLYIHDFFRPLRAQLSPSTSYPGREKRMASITDITDPRSAIVEEFLLEGRWHLMVINERNRVEPFVFTITAINPPTISNETPSSSSRKSSDTAVQACEMNCSGHGECINGKCKCVKGYTGDICEDAVCPLVCSGNGIFSGGVCICNAGFKGKECDIRLNWCEKPDCSGNGKCSASGRCHCNRGWKGEFCEERNCVPLCSNGGICMKGICYCTNGWTGSDCGRPVVMTPVKQDLTLVPRQETKSAKSPLRAAENRRQNHSTISPAKTPTSKNTISPSPEHTTTPSPCSSHGKYDGHVCICREGWTGSLCSERICVGCINGKCENGECVCNAGFTGLGCENRACALGCEDHGECSGNGTCLCQKGWNGENCFIEGCPRSCSGYGECVASSVTHDWSCQCQPGRTGADCAISVELDCHDGLDNDGDELIDCDDPECCNADACRNQGACVFSANPSEVLLRLPGKGNIPFSQRISFIYQHEIQKYADPAKFNDSMVSIIRGRVTWNAGATSSSAGVDFPLPGVRVSDGRTPLWGFTLSRLDGEFDLVVNGGQTIQLRFQRNPFSKVITNVYIPPNEIFHVGDVRMYTEKAPAPRPARRRPHCEKLDQAASHNPILRTSHDFGTDGATRSGLLLDTRSFVKIVELPGSSAKLVYDSSRVLSAQSWIVMGLLNDVVDADLRLIHVEVNLAGRRFEAKLAPSVNLTYTWSWDKQNVYKQSEFGLTFAHIRIGYEYKDCDRPNEIIWYWRTVDADGASARSMEGNAWTIDIHHHLDTINNVIEMGDGGKRFLRNGVRMLETIVGKTSRRSVSCTNCTTVPAEEATLLRPTDIVVTKEGSFYVADHDIIRFVSQSTGLVRNVLQLSAADTSHSYQMAVNPVDNHLYVSLSFTKQVWKVLSNEPEDISNNHVVIAGDGTACTSHDSACGDGGFAVDSQLITPKGIAFDAQGNLFIADGRKIRLVDTTNVIKSIVDSSPSARPSCSQGRFSISSLQLEWPTSLSVQQSTGRLFVLDSNTVYELEHESSTARVAVGSVPSCASNSSFTVSFVKDIAITDSGSLYVLESDGKHVNQVRLLSQDGSSLKLIAGGRSACGCDMPSCECDDSITTVAATQARLNSPMAIALNVKSDLLIVDSGNGKIKKVSRSSASFDSKKGLFTVVDVNRQEMYAFNRHGLHAWTQSLVTGRVVYNFTYNVDTSLGRLSSIHGAGELLLRIIRSNETHVVIETPSGQRTVLVHSLYDGTIDTIQRSENGPMRLRYQPGGCLLSQIQDHFSMTIRYDKLGRVRSVRQDGEGFDLISEKIIDGRYFAKVNRNGEPFASLTMDQEELLYEDSTKTRLNSLDDGFLISSTNMVTLLDMYSHPEHGQPTIMKSKVSIPSVQQPSRRELTYRFDWRPFIKRGSEKRVAEVNGINIYSVAFDRETHSDVIRARSNDAVLLTVGYTDSGEIASIVLPNHDSAQPGKDVARNLTVIYDSLSRRSEIVWGNMSIQAAYDRQNRVVEYIRMKTSPIRFGYHKDHRHPVSVELPNSLKYSLKLDSRGRVKEVTTPTGEVHSFNSIPIGREKIVLRRYPFTKKPFRLALDEKSHVCEFASADDMHHFVSSRNIYGQTDSVLCDSVLTTYSRDSNSMLKLVVSPNLHVNYTWQGPLISSVSFSTLQEKRFSVSTFSYEYDDMFRPTSIHCTIEGIAIESIRIAYDDHSSLLSEIQGYQIVRSSARRKIIGHNMVHEITYDAYMRKDDSRVRVGDNQVVHVITRDITGRVVANEWHGSFGSKRESYEYDKIGRIFALTSSGKRQLLLFNNDGRPHSSNDITFEWHSGGVPKRNNRTEYSVDGNGWVIKRGSIMFEYDCVGRLIGSLLPNGLRFQFSYDHEGRLSTIRKGNSITTLFYALPDQKNLVTHFSVQDSSVGNILYDEKGVPFVLNHNGYRYALITDSFGSLRYVFSDSSIVKEINHDIHGSVLSDSDSEFFVPLGYRGGIDIPEISVSIINGRPLDTQLGRFLTFGPEQTIHIDFSAMETTMDLFSLKPTEREEFPLDISSWFEYVGLSSRLLPPLPLELDLAGVVSARRLASFPTVFKRFSTPTSLSPSALVDTSSSKMLPPNDIRFTSDSSGFFNLFLLVPDVNTTILEPLPSLSADDEALLRLLFNESVEIDWRQWNSGFERHFVRPHLSHVLTSESRSHFTIIVSQEQVELRAEKDKIIVHFGNRADVQKSLIEDLKKKEKPALWRAQQRKVERKDISAVKWTEEQKRQILNKGSVDGYHLEYMNYLNVRFPTIHSWRLVPSR